MCDSAEVNNAMMAMGKGTTWNQIPTKPGSTVSRPIGGHYQFSLPAADEERLGRLFQELDHDKDGRINISDLSKSLARLGRHNAQGQAEAVIKQGDTSRSGDLTISEFLHYMVEHERKLKFAFSALDRNKDGRIDVDEITSSFSALGIGLDREEAKRLLRRIDNDGDLVISYEEWRDFLLFHPMVEDIRSLINYWRLATDLSETPAPCAVPSSRPFLSLKAPVWWDTPLDEDGIPQMSAPFLMNLDDLDVSLVSEHLGLKPPAPEYHDDYCARGIQHGVEVLPSALRHRHLLQLPPSSVLPRSTKPPSMTGPLVGRGLKEMWKPNKPWDICTSLSWHKRLPRFYGVADIGEDLKIPSDLTESEIIAGMWWRHLLAGAAAGAVSRTATAPLDRIKTFLQVHGKEHSNLFHLVKAMIEEGGLVSLWRGNGMNVIKIAPESAIKFMMYEQTKRALKGKRKGEVTISERFLAGSFSGAFAQTIVYPMEVLKTRMALRRTGEFKNARDACMKIYTREGGVKAFYRGFIPNLLGILPMAGIDLCVYETLKKWLLGSNRKNEPSVLIALTCGAISSTTGMLASYPLSLVKTKLQAAMVFTPAGHEPPRMTEIFRTVIANEGMIGLYRGVAPNLMKVIPAVSLSYVVYEKVRIALGVKMT